MNNKNVNHLSRVPTNEVINTNNFKLLLDKELKLEKIMEKSISKIPQNHDYPNPAKQREILRMKVKFLNI